MNEAVTHERSLHFSIQGQLITRLAREKVYYENPPRIPYAIELLMSCLETDQISEGDRLLLAVKILNGQARIVGTYPGSDYGVEMLDEPEGNFNLSERIDQMGAEIQRLEEENRKQIEKLLCVAEFLSEYQMRQINRTWRTEWGESDDIFPDASNVPDSALTFLQSVTGSDDPLADAVERLSSDSTDDYGWLAPDGTFYPVEFADHQQWAWKKLKEMGLVEKYEPNTGKAGDKLVEMGWALLHNPGMGTAFVTQSETKPLTKRQKDFLFDYYSKRQKHDKAKAYLED